MPINSLSIILVTRKPVLVESNLVRTVHVFERICDSLLCCLNSSESRMAFVGLVNSCRWRHDWKEHVFHKAILPAVQGARGRTDIAAVRYGGIAVSTGRVRGLVYVWGGGGESRQFGNLPSRSTKCLASYTLHRVHFGYVKFIKDNKTVPCGTH
jgi:hypothetical protein